MDNQTIGTSFVRTDAIAKVTGKAQYTDDLIPPKSLYGKIIRSTIAHGLVKYIDIREAKQVPGVVRVLTGDDCPQKPFRTGGHPFVIDPEHRDVANQLIFTKRVRLYGDAIGGIIAETPLAAEIALGKIKVIYEEWPFYLTPQEAMMEGAKEIHEGTCNIFADTSLHIGDVEQAFAVSDYVLEESYHVPTVQHCHLENNTVVAYQGMKGEWVCMVSSQIPHSSRQMLSEVFDLPISQFRVIKPMVGGAFGNKQDVYLEPTAVLMSMAVGGRPVSLALSREEVFAHTRVRHAMDFKIKLGITKTGEFTGLDLECISTKGAYASHGHAIALVGQEVSQILYNFKNFRSHLLTVYTNTATAGAMRGYGTPQFKFALESIVHQAARILKMDPVELRMKNVPVSGDIALSPNLPLGSIGLKECLEKGRELFNWEGKLKHKNLSPLKDKKRGVGVGMVCYPSNTKPHSHVVESAGCQLRLNQDGTIKLMVGATEIGQGSDTVFKQMVGETVGVSFDKVIEDYLTDTEYMPYDPGSYASRQSFVTGMAVKKAAKKLKKKILKSFFLYREDLKSKVCVDVKEDYIIDQLTGERLMSIEELGMLSFYHATLGKPLVVESSIKTSQNAYCGCLTFAEVEVDVKTGEVEVLSLLNVHDSGKIINPLQAEGQVQGGMAMGIGYGLKEELRYDQKTGKPLNNNLLDYKVGTMLDMPDLDCGFVELEDSLGPFGNKALGEPPLCSPAPAIANAIEDAIGVAFQKLPITAEAIVAALNKQ